MSALPRFVLLLMLPLAVGGCGRRSASQQDLASLDRELTDANSAANARDPALTAAVNSPIMVDPALHQQSNAVAVRPAGRPDPLSMPPDATGAPPAAATGPLRPAPPATAGCPQCRAKRHALTLAAVAERGGGAAAAGCTAGLRYASSWADRLPAGVPLFPDAVVSEAAGSDAGGCALRVVSFTSAAPLGRIANFYYTRATAAGFSADHRVEGEEHMLGGTRGNTAFVAFLDPRPGGGTAVDLVATARP